MVDRLRVGAGVDFQPRTLLSETDISWLKWFHKELAGVSGPIGAVEVNGDELVAANANP
jgi:hypothetical protein